MKLNHMDVLKRAWRILWSYKALWVFGIILALTTSRGGGGNNGGQATFSGGQGSGFDITPPPEIQRELGEVGEVLDRFFEQIFNGGAIPGRLIALGVGLACLVGLLIVVATIARYVAETALIKMVDDHETTGERRRVKEGFKFGWSRSAFRQWLIGLVIGVPLVVGFILALALAALPLLGWLTENVTLGIFGTIGSIGLFFLLIFVAIVIGTLAMVLVKLAWRAAALEDLGVLPSIGRGWALIRTNAKDIALMWLIMFGIGLGFAILLIPVVLLLLMISGVSGGLVFLVARGLAELLVSGIARWIVAGILGGTVFLALMAIPLAFIGGLYEVYRSTVWTLTYRELALTAPLVAQPGSPVAPHTESETPRLQADTAS
ncbi:MAG: hypothetical protein JXC32_00445 [Anaerolineae bacterium]|nr:hypothetical protein [Anaerolineae bacterium]